VLSKGVNEAFEALIRSEKPALCLIARNHSKTPTSRRSAKRDEYSYPLDGLLPVGDLGMKLFDQPQSIQRLGNSRFSFRNPDGFDSRAGGGTQHAIRSVSAGVLQDAAE
jgi:hypothetical protein